MFRLLVLVSTSLAVASASYVSQPVPAAVISKHQVNHYDVPSSGYIKPTTIDVPPNVIPVNFIFRSASSPVNVQQKHQGTPGSFKESNSQDEPHKLVHTVTKPIIQEVREVISPFRKIIQTIEPVHEQIQTIVAKKAYGQPNQGYSSGNDSPFGGSSSMGIYSSMESGGSSISNGYSNGGSSNGGSANGISSGFSTGYGSYDSSMENKVILSPYQKLAQIVEANPPSMKAYSGGSSSTIQMSDELKTKTGNNGMNSNFNRAYGSDSQMFDNSSPYPSLGNNKVYSDSGSSISDASDSTSTSTPKY